MTIEMKKVILLFFILAGTVQNYAQLNADGWTILDPNKAEKIIYVSSSIGNDNNGMVYPFPSSTIGEDPFLPANPIQAFQSVEAAISSIEEGEAVWVLLKRGDTFYKTLRPITGKSIDQPFLYSSYGTSNKLPLLKTGSNAGVFHCCKALEHFWVVGLSFYAQTRDPNSPEYESDAGNRGIYLETIRGRKLNNILVEGNVINYYKENVIQSFNGTGIVTDIKVRRNMFLDGYNVSGELNNSVGLFVQNVDGFLLEENIFDHNGWLIPSYGNSEGQDKSDGQATQFSHNTYFVDNKNVIFRNNSFNRPSSNATKWVSTAIGKTQNILIENNLFNDCEIAISMGSNYPGTSYRFKDIDIKNNVIVDQGLSDLTKRQLSWGVDVHGWDGGKFNNNIITSQQTLTRSGFAARIAGRTKEVTIGGNIFYDLKDRRGVLISDKGEYENLLVTQNSFVYYDDFKRFVRLEIGDFSELTFDRNTYFDADNISRPFVILNQDYDLNEWEIEFPNENPSVELPDYPDPTRDLDRYINEILGLPNRDAYYAELRNQSIFNWREAYTGNAIASWIEKGFDRTADVTPPVPDAQNLPDITAECRVDVLEMPTATDDVYGQIEGTANVTDFPITESRVVLWTYEDQEGNKSYQEQDIIIDDSEAPVFDLAELPDLVGDCSVTIDTIPTASDFCNGVINATANVDVNQVIRQSQTIIWTYADSSGNTASQTQEVIIEENQDPVMDQPELDDIIAECGTIVTEIPTATDFCQGVITATANIDINEAIRESMTIVWTYNEGLANAISQTQEVIITDNEAPVVDEQEFEALTGECYVLLEGNFYANDVCDGLVQGIPDRPLGELITESTVVNWSFTDNSGNTFTQPQQIIILPDSSGPVPLVADLPEIVDYCDVQQPEAPVATDACDGAINGVPNITFPIVDENVNEIIWTYEDSSGNSISQTQKVTLTKPVGCVAGNVTLNDFQFLVTDEVCYNENNGSITILASKPAPYNITLEKTVGLQSRHNFNELLNLENLSPGDYNICIKIDGFDVELCKTLNIAAAEDLVVTTEVNDVDKEITLFLRGSDEYIITLNDQTITNTDGNLVLDLEWGTNELKVQTENQCQEDFEATIKTSKELSFYPNPVSQGPLNVSLKGIPSRPTQLSVMSMSGKILKVINDVSLEADQLVIDVTGFTPGTYIVKAITAEKTYSFTVIKI
jgi:hypothetical protein